MSLPMFQEKAQICSEVHLEDACEECVHEELITINPDSNQAVIKHLLSQQISKSKSRSHDLFQLFLNLTWSEQIPR